MRKILLSKDTRYKEFYIFALGGLLATLVFFIIYGTSILNPTYDGWLYYGINKPDTLMHYYGWRYFRKSEWTFPLGMMDGITYPNQLSIVYTDSIPLFALFFKILSPVLPNTFQYIGLFGLTSFFLMGGFSSIILYSFTKNPLYSLIASLLFDFNMMFIMRMFFHTALSAQWLILASIYIFLKKETEWNINRSFVAWSILSCLAVSIQPYFYPMVFGILFCSLINYLIRNDNKNVALLRIAIVLAGSIVFASLLGWVLGVFSSSISGEGTYLGWYSFNYNSFFNTYGYSFLIDPLPNLSECQYESYCYLGLGLYLTFILSGITYLIRIRKNKQALPSLKPINTLPFVIYVACFVLFASGPLFSFGSFKIDYNLPDIITSIWSYFRSTGRFILPVAYLLFIFICVFFNYVFRNNKIKYLLLSFAICIQIYENYPYINAVYDHFTITDYTYKTALIDPKWETISQRYEHIVFYPDVSKFYSFNSTYQAQAQELMIYAEKNNITTNINYICRDISNNKNEEVYALFESKDSFDDSTVYVFIDDFPMEDTGLYYYTIDGFTIGLTEPL